MEEDTEAMVTMDDAVVRGQTRYDADMEVSLLLEKPARTSPWRRAKRVGGWMRRRIEAIVGSTWWSS
jgi:hypothetical protein